MKKVPDGWDYAIPRTLIVRSFGDLVETPAPYMRDYMSSFFRTVLYQNGRAVSSGILEKSGKICISLIMRAGFAGREGRERRKNILPKSCEICCNRTKAISLQIRQKIALGLSLWVYARDAICGRRNSKKVSAAGDRPSRQAMPISTFCGGSSGRMRTFPDHARPLMALFMLRPRPASTIE